MLLPIVTALAIFALLSLPGWILAADRPRHLWFHVAAGFSSQFAIILATAIIALLSPMQLDVRFVFLVAFVAIILALWLRRGSQWFFPLPVDPWLLLPPVLATLTAAYITSSAITFGESGLIVHSWFNADGFKHLGHVQALAHLGISARDIFGADQPLAYYWLFYILPGTGAALHGNAAAALVATGLVQTFAFWILVTGLLRMAGANAAWSTVLALLAFLSPTPDGLIALAASGWDVVGTATEVNVEGMAGNLLNASTLFRLSLYIPQHQLMLAGLMSWAILIIAPRDTLARPLRVLAHAPLIAAGAVSTLFGIACLGTFALMTLLDNRTTLVRRVTGIALVGLLALAVPLALGVVDASGGSGLDSPIFASDAPRPAPPLRFLMGLAGLVLAYGVFLVGAVGLLRGWQARDLSDEKRNTILFAIALVATGLAILLASTVVGSARLVLEMQLRASLLPYLGLLIGAACLLTGQRRQSMPPLAIAFGTPLLLLGLATPIIDTVWHGHSASHWRIAVPADDIAVLSALDAQAPPNAVVLQYPELPFLSGGRDIWAAIFGGRSVYASHRATHFGAMEARLAAAAAYYGGTGPLPGGEYDYVYLSRALHAQSYDTLFEQLNGDGWLAQDCRPDACIFKRN